MTKIRKQKRKKRYRYNVSRKKLKSRRSKLPSITCPQVKKAWEQTRTVEQNLNDMGLAYDSNKALKIPSAKELMQPMEVDSESGNCDDEMRLPRKNYVTEELENDAKAPRVKNLKLPNNQVAWLSYLMDKYKEDYKAMARDPKNYYQETWRQIRNKIKKFKNIPEQYGKYMESQKKQSSVESSCS